MRLEPNDRLGSYKITRFVREGSSGALYVAHRIGGPGFAPYSAIKVVAPSLYDTAEKSDLFDKEIIRASKVDDPRIVRLEELGDDRGTRYVAMECVRGFSLSDMLAFYYERDRRIRPGLAVYLVMQAALGIQAVHEARDSKGNHLRFVHGGITTKKLLVTWKGHLKIVRLGYLETTKDMLLSSWQRLFRAPELDAPTPEGTVDGRVDVYALGAVLLAALARGGLPVLDGTIDRAGIADALARADDVPSALGEAIVHAIEPRRADRPNALGFYRELVDAMPAALKVTPSDVARELAAIRLDREFNAFAQDRPLVGASYVPPRMTDVPSPFSSPPRTTDGGESTSERVEVPALPALPIIGARASDSTETVRPAEIVEPPPSAPVVIDPTPSLPMVRQVTTADAPKAEPEPSKEEPKKEEAPKVEPKDEAPSAPAAAAEAIAPATPTKPPFPPLLFLALAFVAGVLLTLVLAALRGGSSPHAPEPASSTLSRAPGAQLFPAFQPVPISSSLRAIAERGVATAEPGPWWMDAAAVAALDAGPHAKPDAQPTTDDPLTRASAHVLAGDLGGARAVLEGRMGRAMLSTDELDLLRAICRDQEDQACVDRLREGR